MYPQMPTAPVSRPQIRDIRPPMPGVGGGVGPANFAPPNAAAGMVARMAPAGAKTFANPMQDPLSILANAKMEHTGMIIKGLLKHLDKTTPDNSAPIIRPGAGGHENGAVQPQQ